MSVRWHGGGNKQRKGSPHWIQDTYPSEGWRGTNKRGNNQSTSIGQWEWGVRCVKHLRSPSQTPRSDDDSQGVQYIDKICVFAAAQPCRLPTEHVKLPKTSAWNWKLPKKPSTVSKIHRRGWSLTKSGCHRGGTSLPVPTGGTANRLRTDVHTHHDSTPFLKLRVDRQNRPRGKCSEDDGALRPRGTPCLIDRKIEKGEIIRVIRRTDYFWRHDGVQRDHPFGADGSF